MDRKKLITSILFVLLMTPLWSTKAVCKGSQAMGSLPRLGAGVAQGKSDVESSGRRTLGLSSETSRSESEARPEPAKKVGDQAGASKMVAKGNVAESRTETLTVAGGCFWCMEPPFEQLDGVLSVVSGYMGGKTPNPTYNEVSAGGTGHAEVVQITFQPTKISLETLLDVFWKNIDPTDANGQFVDQGRQYRSAIFYASKEQKLIAEASKKRLEKSGIFTEKIVTEIESAGPFYKAEEYHQDYYKVNPVRYRFYRYRSGRDQFLDKFWGKKRDRQIDANVKTELKGAERDSPEQEDSRQPSSNKPWPTVVHTKDWTKPTDSELKKHLSPMQYKVTQKEATEPPFENEFWDNKEEGIYVDVVSGEPLFSSAHKYDSKTGWPSFTQPIEAQNIEERVDRKLWSVRTEVRSKNGQSHLGHVFDDGPAPTGKRYCINSASLRFIPKKDLANEGYRQFTALFEKP